MAGVIRAHEEYLIIVVDLMPKLAYVHKVEEYSWNSCKYSIVV